MERTVAEIAAHLHLDFEGDGSTRITGVAGLREAAPGDISFLAQSRYAHLLAQTGASAVVVDGSFAEPFGGALIRSDDPNAAFQQIVAHFSPTTAPPPRGIHPTAVIEADVELGEDVGVGAHAIIASGAVVGARTKIWPGCYVGEQVRLGEDCILYPQVVLREHCEVGDRVILHPGAVIGSDGFGYEADAQGRRTKVEQLGIVTIGNDVEIGCNATVDRARFGRTRIGEGAKIDNLVHVAHNCVVGDHVVLVAQVGIAGSTVVGDKAILGGQVGVAGHKVIGAGAIISAQSGITKDVPAGGRVVGFPAMPHAQFGRAQFNLHRIPQLKERIEALEERIRELESRG